MGEVSRKDLRKIVEVHVVVATFLGIFAGLLYGIGGFFIDVFDENLGTGTVLALFAIPIMPILSAIAGLISGTVLALLYQMARRYINPFS